MKLWFSRSADRAKRPLVRPWAMAGPIIILLIAAPLLRPLRAPGLSSERERIALEAVRSMLVNKTFALDTRIINNTDAVWRADGQSFSKDPPTFQALLGGVGWCIERVGIPLSTNPNLLSYLLIFFAITLPTALACGSIYRMARMFELSRPWRVGLALSCVLATGWISYAVVLLPHALAAALVVLAVASIVQIAQSQRPNTCFGWFLAAGFCSALAAAIEPLAIWALPVVIGSVFAIKLPAKWRVSALLIVLLGAAGPLTVHAVLNRSITGDYYPPRWHATHFIQPVMLPRLGDEADPVDATVWLVMGRSINRLLILTVGPHGVFSHFPVLVLGVVGAGIILRRHWTGSIKWLAGGSVLALLTILIYKSVTRLDEIDTNFAAPRLVMILPLLMLWAGSWIRRPHSGLVWTVAGVALGVSIAISLLGATAPAPPGGYQHFTAAEVVVRWAHPQEQVAQLHKN